MSKLQRTLFLSAVVVMLCPLAAMAQHPSELVGFNGPPIDDPNTSREMFQSPQFSGSSSGYIVPNSEGVYDNNAAFRAAGMQTEGAAALRAFFSWIDPSDPDAWMRLTTFNGPERPNPALHTEGKVRFKITNRSELFDGEIGICLGIRETGVEVPQMYDGGTSGDLEWVGVDTTPNGIIAGPDMIVDTQANPASDDVQVYPVGYDLANDPNEPLPTGTAVVSPGPNGMLETTPVPDDELRFGYFISASGARRPIPAITLPPAPAAYELEWNLTTGVVSIGGTPQGGGIAGFTGDGDLNITPPRGTLEHIVLTNLPADPAILIDIAIDELQFEATEPDPVLAPTVVAPILANDESVTVTDLMLNVELVTLYCNDDEVEARPVSTPDDVIFTIAPAFPGDVYTATQTVDEMTSSPSDPVTVTYSDHGPVIYYAPAEGDMIVTVMDLDPNADAVSVFINDTIEFSDTPDPGAGRWDVAVTPLVMGDVLTAYYWVDGAPSVASPPETVTTATPIVIFCDDFEAYADQAAMEAVWTQGAPDDPNYAPVELASDMNATCDPDATQSAMTQTYTSWMWHSIPETVPTLTEPVVFNVNIYDPIGEDPNGLVVQWAELNYIGGPDWFLMHVGMLGWDNTDNIHYDFRAVGNGGPNWIDLDQYDAPLRSVGWHNFTVVHKGNSIDVYVDELLSAKNVALNAETTYAQVDIGGGGYDSQVDVWFDDFCLEMGPVHFGCIQGIIGDIDGDGDVDLSDLAALLGSYNLCTGDPGFNPAADIDNNGCVELSDLAALLGNYGYGT